jgi:hypothetical protein
LSAAYDVLIASGGIAIGAAGGAMAVYFYRRPRRKDSSSAAYHKELAKLDPFERLVPKTQLERTRRELKTLLLEKELVSVALTRLYKAEAAHEITREEREILAGRYRSELKGLDEKISKIDAFVEVGDLETLREQLLDLVSKKIEAIERRIDRTRITAAPLLADLLKTSEPENTVSSEMAEKSKQKEEKVPNISELLATGRAEGPFVDSQESKVREAEQRISQRKKTPNDDDVEQLQKELLDALDKLQKLDVEN